MKAPARLGLYGPVLGAVFVVSAFTTNTVIPEAIVQAWAEETESDTHHGQGDSEMNRGAHGGPEADRASLGLGQDGYRLTESSAPMEVGTGGELAFSVTGPEWQPVTDFELDHEQEMHLIVVRADGQKLQHVHSERDEAGTWSIPWEWGASGTHRMFPDFVPGETGEGMTLSTNVHVAGSYIPVRAQAPVTKATVDGFDVEVTGDLLAGEASEPTLTVSRDGDPVTALEPYLSVFGHLVASRDGDLTYLHVHPDGNAPEEGEPSGQRIVFEATAPTEGRYLLFLDFQVDGQMHTAPLIIDTTGAATSATEGGQGSCDMTMTKHKWVVESEI